MELCWVNRWLMRKFIYKIINELFNRPNSVLEIYVKLKIFVWYYHIKCCCCDLVKARKFVNCWRWSTFIKFNDLNKINIWIWIFFFNFHRFFKHQRLSTFEMLWTFFLKIVGTQRRKMSLKIAQDTLWIIVFECKIKWFSKILWHRSWESLHGRFLTNH